MIVGCFDTALFDVRFCLRLVVGEVKNATFEGERFCVIWILFKVLVHEFQGFFVLFRVIEFQGLAEGTVFFATEQRGTFRHGDLSEKESKRIGEAKRIKITVRTQREMDRNREEWRNEKVQEMKTGKNERNLVIIDEVIVRYNRSESIMNYQ